MKGYDYTREPVAWDSLKAAETKRHYIKELVLIWNMLQMRCWGREEKGQFTELRCHSVKDVKR